MNRIMGTARFTPVCTTTGSYLGVRRCMKPQSIHEKRNRWQQPANKIGLDNLPLELDEDEDGFIDLDGDEFEDDEAEDVVAALGLGEDDVAPGISTGSTIWGEAGFKAAEKVCNELPVLKYIASSHAGMICPWIAFWYAMRVAQHT